MGDEARCLFAAMLFPMRRSLCAVLALVATAAGGLSVPAADATRPLRAPTAAAQVTAAQTDDGGETTVADVAEIDPTITALANAGWSANDPDGVIDDELLQALASSGLVGDWLEAAETTSTIAILRASGPDYDQHRNTLLDILADRGSSASELSIAETTLEETETAHRRELRERARATTAVNGWVERQADLEDRIDVAQADLGHARETLAQIAITRYMGDSLADDLQLFQTQEINDANRRNWILEATDDDYYAVVDDLEAELADLAVERKTMESRREQAEHQAAQIVRTIDRLADQITNQAAVVSDLQRRVADHRIDARELMPVLHEARLTATIERLRLPIVTVDSYVRAAATMDDQPPECAIDWASIGAVSRVESQHGTYLGRSVLASGDLDRPLLGLLLNGSGVATVRDTDGGALDGNGEFDRALGPMQFLPRTWRVFEVDGDSDGDTDPQSMYDATATAAAYLCNLGQTKRTADFGARLLGYNASSAYVTKVLSSASELRSFELPTISG